MSNPYPRYNVETKHGAFGTTILPGKEFAITTDHDHPVMLNRIPARVSIHAKLDDVGTMGYRITSFYCNRTDKRFPASDELTQGQRKVLYEVIEEVAAWVKKNPDVHADAELTRKHEELNRWLAEAAEMRRTLAALEQKIEARERELA